MITAREDFMMTVLGCGICDLSLLDDVQYDMCDVFDRLKQYGIERPSLGSLMQAVFELGFEDIQNRINERIEKIEDAGGRRKIRRAEQEELDSLKMLNPHEDMATFHNYIDTHVYIRENEEVYRKYLADALDQFAEATGFNIEGGWG